jgi:hypothetical protein
MIAAQSKTIHGIAKHLSGFGDFSRINAFGRRNRNLLFTTRATFAKVVLNCFVFRCIFHLCRLHLFKTRFITIKNRKAVAAFFDPEVYIPRLPCQLMAMKRGELGKLASERFAYVEGVGHNLLSIAVLFFESQIEMDEVDFISANSYRRPSFCSARGPLCKRSCRRRRVRRRGGRACSRLCR